MIVTCLLSLAIFAFSVLGGKFDISSLSTKERAIGHLHSVGNVNRCGCLMQYEKTVEAGGYDGLAA
jgi:hypothetical protein